MNINNLKCLSTNLEVLQTDHPNKADEEIIKKPVDPKIVSKIVLIASGLTVGSIYAGERYLNQCSNIGQSLSCFSLATACGILAATAIASYAPMFYLETTTK